MQSDKPEAVASSVEPLAPLPPLIAMLRELADALESGRWEHTGGGLVFDRRFGIDNDEVRVDANLRFRPKL